jgi:hypothetical protein
MKIHRFKDVTMCEIKISEIIKLCKDKAEAQNLPTDVLAVIIDTEVGEWNLAIQAQKDPEGIELRNGQWLMLQNGDVTRIKQQMLQKEVS